MSERNKSWFRILSFVSAIIYAAAMLLLALALRGDVGAMAVTLLSLLFSGGMVAVLVPLVLRNPNINRQYSLRRVDGRLRWQRRHYKADPCCWRHLSYGLMLFLLSLFMLSLSLLAFFFGSDDMPNGWLIGSSVVFVAAVVAVLEWGEHKVEKEYYQ